MTFTLQIPGKLETENTNEQALSSGITLTAQKTLQIGAARGEAGTVSIPDVKPRDAVCVHYADGLELWMSAGELADRARSGTARGAAAGEVIDIAPAALARTSERGVAGAVVTALEFFGIDLKKEAAEGVAKWFETKQLEDREGVCSVDLAQAAPVFGVPLEDGEIAGGGPLLVFLHGTASSFTGSFGKLWDGKNAKGAKLRQDLAQKYAERVYALEHRSLTESPIANALALVQRLPQGAELHLVSHSRGGLVGELLCLAGHSGTSLAPELLDRLYRNDRTQGAAMGFGKRDAGVDRAYAEQRAQLTELLGLLDTKQIRVTRFVRVACPALGTTLASGKLDRWLSLLKFAGGDGIVADIRDFLLAVVNQRTDPRTLPGLEAMMPGSALVTLLNLEGLKVNADLSVIAGDCEGNSLWGRTKLLITDWFYAGDHDLVVNTGSMYGGARRDQARKYFTRGAEVNHFNYFANPDTVDKLASGLLREDGTLGGFDPLLEADRKAPARAVPQRFSGPHPVAFVLPGIMGSGLKAGDEPIWLEKLAIFQGKLERLAIDQPNVAPTAPLEDYYGDFIEFLGRTHEVMAFPYDWRRSVTDAADALHEAVLRKLPEAEASRQPIRIVAHSMGGLVARMMLARHPQTWNRLKNLDGFRLLMLGTPNYGAFQAVRLVVGQYRMANVLALLDFGHDRDELLALFSRYPGALELLPWKDTGNRDFASGDLWARLRDEVGEFWPLPDGQALAQVRETWKVLNGAPIDGNCMTYVAGWAPRTPCDYRVVRRDDMIQGNIPQIEFSATRRGDGTVTWDAGRLEGVRTWYVEAEHGDLLSAGEAFPAYLDLLQSGKTARPGISDSEPAASRGLPDEAVYQAMPPDIVEGFDAGGGGGSRAFAGIGGFGSGAKRPSGGGRRLPSVAVKITRGDLAYAGNPVCVGHYQGDTVVSAEAQLDKALGGALSNRQKMGIYPGRLGTWEIFIQDDPHGKPGGALVVGLGQVGELTPGGLEAMLARTLSDYALQVMQWRDDRFGSRDGVRSAKVSFLLIGTGAGGFEVRASVEAILRAVKRANEKLVESRLDHRVLIDEIEVLELYQDIAIQAARALDEVLADPDLAAHFTWSPREISDNDGQRRILCEDAPHWWQRLEIAYHPEREELRFIALTNRARAEETLVAGDLRLAQGFIRQSIATTRSSREISRTLFEMLLPNRLKQFAPDRRDLVLVVDAKSAAYPWELLEDRWTDGKEPPAVAAGMVRQFKTPNFRATPAHADHNRAFVVGNPLQTRYGNLPGARDEAEDVVRVLAAGGYAVKQAIETRADEILTGLHGDAYRILHLAGHGVFEFKVEQAKKPCDCCHQLVSGKDKTVSGMVIGDHTFLTPGDVEQMRWVPELVFINCCHLGNTRESARSARKFNRLAANLATQFIGMGVKAVVAAGWAVDDAAAKSFATHFYQRMLAGETFGRAVQGARKAIFDGYPNLNTWGAYQCYGDPAYRLDDRSDDGGGHRSTPLYTRAELVVALENAANRARNGMAQPGMVKHILANLTDAQKAAWLAEADVLAALGLAYGEFGEMENAVSCLDNAVKAEKAMLSLKALEQRANFKARLGARLYRTDRSDEVKTRVESLFTEAFAELNALLAIGATTERYNLLASAYKRAATTLDEPAKWRESLKKMTAFYVKAEEHFAADPKNRGKHYPYPSLNKWVGRILLAATANALSREALLKECRLLADWARAENDKNYDFWTATAIPESLLVQALAEGKLGEARAEILQGYSAAKERGASPREFASIVDQFDFLEIMLPHCYAAEQARELRDIATGIRQLADITSM